MTIGMSILILSGISYLLLGGIGWFILEAALAYMAVAMGVWGHLAPRDQGGARP